MGDAVIKNGKSAGGRCYGKDGGNALIGRASQAMYHMFDRA